MNWWLRIGLVFGGYCIGRWAWASDAVAFAALWIGARLAIERFRMLDARRHGRVYRAPWVPDGEG